MVNDDERREVARRLREHSGAKLFTGDDVERLIGAEPSGFRPKDADTNYNLLADLIEPSCDHDALLVLADEMDTEGLNGWAGPVNVGEYARRIRGACGVTADE